MTTSPNENETLLLAVLSQLTVTKLDYVLLASQINSPSPGAAAKKWQRFQKKLRDNSSGKGSGASASASPVATVGKGTGVLMVGKKPVGVVKRSTGSGKVSGIMGKVKRDWDDSEVVGGLEFWNGRDMRQESQEDGRSPNTGKRVEFTKFGNPQTPSSSTRRTTDEEDGYGEADVGRISIERLVSVGVEHVKVEAGNSYGYDDQETEEDF